LEAARIELEWAFGERSVHPSSRNDGPRSTCWLGPSARRLFTTTGYAATSVAQIAAEAGVKLDAGYASVWRKPQLLLAILSWSADDIAG
jgi:Bacterial regulatory proteins, tetR family